MEMVDVSDKTKVLPVAKISSETPETTLLKLGACTPPWVSIQGKNTICFI